MKRDLSRAATVQRKIVFFGRLDLSEDWLSGLLLRTLKDYYKWLTQLFWK